MASSSKAYEPAWLGIDLGTQSVRAMVVDSSGTILGSGSEKLTSHRTEGRHEQQPEQWWSSTVTACRQALQPVTADRIRGVAVDGTSGTFLIADHSGRPLTPGLMYDDARAIEEAKVVTDAGAAVWRSLGYHRMPPSWALPKLLWLNRHQAPTLESGTLQHQADFINRRLIGRAVSSDSSNALKSGFDLINERWPSEVLRSLGIPLQMLPPVVRSGSLLGEVCNAAAEATGIPIGTPVIAGMTDGCAAQIGAGALSPGSWNCVLGTTLVFKGVAYTPPNDPRGIVYSHRSPDGNWLPGGASSIGAGILTSDFPGRDLDLLTTEAARRGVTDVLSYPLAGKGERFPFHAPDACRFTIGQPRDETEHFASILHGIAFIERLCFDYLDFIGLDISGRLTFTGGASRNRHWCQLCADVLNRPVTLVENAESALGMAILAAAQGRSLIEVANQMVRTKEIIEPRVEVHRRLRDAYARLLDELTRRGWLPAKVKDHAINRATA